MFKKEWFNQKITFWQKVRLLFIKPKITIDFGRDSKMTICKFKVLNGKTYITEIK